MLPIFEKILELIVKSQIKMFLENNKIIIEQLENFRKQFLYETTIKIVDKWKLIVSKRKMVEVIFMDLKRAFEIIDRERLCRKIMLVWN